MTIDAIMDSAQADDRWWQLIRATGIPPCKIAEAIAAFDWPVRLATPTIIDAKDLEKTIQRAGEFVRENLNVAAQLADWVTPGQVADADDVQPGSGAIVRKGLRKIAVYRDASGKLVERSAVCRHVGCVVNWNSTENPWDCPCHGSRYDATGHVVNGPSNQDLAPAHEPAKAKK